MRLSFISPIVVTVAKLSRPHSTSSGKVGSDEKFPSAVRSTHKHTATPYANSTTLTSTYSGDESSTSASAQTSASLSVGTAAVTSATGTTSTASSKITQSAAGTCCYLRPIGVGINTWYTSSLDLTVATVVTTWLKYNNTLIAGNSTTKTVLNATSAYGSYGFQTLTTYSAVSYESSVTATFCGNYVESPLYSCLTTATTLVQGDPVFTMYTVTSDIIDGVPNTLLPPEAGYCGGTIVGAGTVANFPEQGLTIQSPTPFYSFNRVQFITNMPCMTTETLTNFADQTYTTISEATGISWSYFITTVPLSTTTRLPPEASASWPAYPEYSNDYLNFSLAMPFPSGGYSNFSFDSIDVIQTPPDNYDAYMFKLPDDFPKFLAGIPAAVSHYPNIGSCTNDFAGGEPTVHIAVNSLTDTNHVTVTMAGALGASATTPSVTTTSSKTPEVSQPVPSPVSSETLPGTSSAVVHSSITSTDTPQQTAQPPIVPSSSTTPAADVTKSIAATPQDAASPSETLISHLASGSTQTATTEMTAAPPNESPSSSANIGGYIASVLGYSAATCCHRGRQHLSLAASGSSLVSNGVTIALNPAPTASAVVPPPVITAAGSVVTADSASHYVIGSQTVAPESAVTVAGNTYSLAASGSALVSNGATFAINPAQTGVSPVAVPISQVPGASTSSFVELILPSTTLLPGSAATISGTTYSLPPTGSAVLVNSVSSSLTPGSPLTLAGGLVATPTVGSALVVGSQTLASGHAIAVSGTTYSLSGSQVFVGASPSAAVSGTSISAAGVPSGSSSVAAYTGGARAVIVSLEHLLLGALVWVVV